MCLFSIPKTNFMDSSLISNGYLPLINLTPRPPTKRPIGKPSRMQPNLGCSSAMAAGERTWLWQLSAYE